MKSKKPRYKGELGKPIYVGSIPFEAANEKQQERNEQRIEQAAINKLRLLMEHYKIPNKDDYFSLALALAKDWVPGFQVRTVPVKLEYGTWGAVIRDTKPTKWPPERLLKLLNAVAETKQKHAVSKDREALKILMRKKEWSRPYNRDEQKWLETLESRLQDAKREERGRDPAHPASAAILPGLEAALARLATATAPAATTRRRPGLVAVRSPNRQRRRRQSRRAVRQPRRHGRRARGSQRRAPKGSPPRSRGSISSSLIS